MRSWIFMRTFMIRIVCIFARHACCGVPSISRANAGHARCSTLLRWRYPELCRLHRFRLFPMGALHQRIPAAHSGRPRRCVARSTAWGIRWFGAGRAGIRSMTKFFRGGGCAVSSRNSHRRDERRAQLTGLLDASGTALRLAAPLVDLLVRFSLAKVFFAPGMLPSSHLFQFAQTAGPLQDEHLFWAALFGWYVAQGAGPLSLDHVLGKGLGLSPLPLAGRAMAAADWFARWVGPLYRLLVLLGLAVALAGVALASGMLRVTASAMLPATASGMLPRPWPV